MFIAIVQHTPPWVWGLLVTLFALGLSQTRSREVSLRRITILPLVLLALSLAGVVGAFAHAPIALGAWTTGVAAALLAGRGFVAVPAARWSPQTGTLQVPGSWLPMVLIVGLFCIKYFAGASLALHPGLATDSTFAGFCGLAYGSFSGLFLARSISLRSLANGGNVLRAA